MEELHPALSANPNPDILVPCWPDDASCFADGAECFGNILPS